MGNRNWCCLKGVFQVGVVIELDFWFLIHFVSGTIHTVNSGMTSVFIVATQLEFYPDKPETLISRDFFVAFTKGGGVLFETVFYLMIRRHLEIYQNLDLPPHPVAVVNQGLVLGFPILKHVIMFGGDDSFLDGGG